MPTVLCEKLPDLGRHLIGMRLGQMIGGGHVTGDDAFDDPLMLIDVLRRLRLIVQAQYAAAFIRQAFEKACVIRSSLSVGHGCVKIAVGGDHRQRILFCHGGGEALLMRADRLQDGGTVVLCRQSGGHAVHQGQCVKEMVQVQHINVGYHGLPVRQRFDQPCAGQLHLVDRAAGRWAQIKDFVAQKVIDKFDTQAASAFRGHCAFLQLVLADRVPFLGPTASGVVENGLAKPKVWRNPWLMSKATFPSPRLRLRLLFDGGLMLGPGKAELLERIAATGSISAAGRDMGMSYKRAWMLVEAMNTAFRTPVVASARGGPGGGGAALTETGQTVLAHFRAIEAAAARAAAAEIAALQALVRDGLDGK